MADKHVTPQRMAVRGAYQSTKADTLHSEAAERRIEPAYLSTRELSRRWKISANTLRNWRFKGIGPRYFKPGSGAVRYRIEDVYAWERSHTIG